MCNAFGSIPVGYGCFNIKTAIGCAGYIEIIKVTVSGSNALYLQSAVHVLILYQYIKSIIGCVICQVGDAAPLFTYAEEIGASLREYTLSRIIGKLIGKAELVHVGYDGNNLRSIYGGGFGFIFSYGSAKLFPFVIVIELFKYHGKAVAGAPIAAIDDLGAVYGQICRGGSRSVNIGVLKGGIFALFNGNGAHRSVLHAEAEPLIYFLYLHLGTDCHILDDRGLTGLYGNGNYAVSICCFYSSTALLGRSTNRHILIGVIRTQINSKFKINAVGYLIVIAKGMLHYLFDDNITRMIGNKGIQQRRSLGDDVRQSTSDNSGG